METQYLVMCKEMTLAPNTIYILKVIIDLGFLAL